MIRLFLVLILFLLQGCMDAAITGAQVVYNHDHITKSLNDQYISTQAYQQLVTDNRRFDHDNISIATFHKEVLITGQVSSVEKRNEVVDRIKSVSGIKKIYNFLDVGPPSSSLIRVSDSWITAKIKSQLIASDDIEPDKIKVVTENGTVFLMGILMADQADIAVDIARSTRGVQRVIKLFTYLRVSKT